MRLDVVAHIHGGKGDVVMKRMDSKELVEGISLILPNIVMAHFWALVLTIFAPHLANRMLRLSFVWSVISFAIRINVSPQVMHVALANLHLVLTAGGNENNVCSKKRKEEKKTTWRQNKHEKKKPWQKHDLQYGFSSLLSTLTTARERRGKGDAWPLGFCVCVAGDGDAAAGGAAACPPGAAV